MRQLQVPIKTLAPVTETVKRDLLRYSRYVYGYQAAGFQHTWADLLMDDRVRRLVLVAPPESGKTAHLNAYAAWLIGRNPQIHVGFISNTARQAARSSALIRETIRSNERFHHLFPEVRLDEQRRTSEDEWFVTRPNPSDKDATVQISGFGGPILGARLDVAIVDDYSDAENTATHLQREKAWEWLQANVLTRLNPDTGRLLVIQTRWHPDDIVGHLERLAVPVTFRTFPALGPDGAALWPERWSRAGLEAKRRELGTRLFELHYQGSVQIVEGQLFQREWFEIVNDWPRSARSVRYWDLAASTGLDADSTVGMRVALQDSQFWVVDVQRVRRTPFEVERLVRQTAELDGTPVEITVEQEPGSSGVSILDHFKRRVLAGFACRADRVTGPKEGRALVAAAAAEAGNIKLVRGRWNEAFLEELSVFPHGAHDDQVDALSGAMGALTRRRGGRVLPVQYFW